MRLYKLALLLLFAWASVQAQSKIQNPETAQPKTVAAAANCTALSPCSSGSINLAWDSTGTPCGSPAWGNCSSIKFPLTFEGVPTGAHVIVTRFWGDTIAWASAPVSAGHHAGILWGAWSSSPLTNPVMDGSVVMSNSSCEWYDQGSVSNGDFTVLFDRPNLNWPLAGDNILTVQLAQFLNNTSASIHVELTVTLQYFYIQ
jgi:hypothetical protein